MAKLLNQTLGYYNSSFFRMHIATDEKIDLRTLNAKDFEVLIHEYIHFIQDITTIHGLANTFTTIQVLKYLTNKIYKTPNNKFNVPFDLNNVSNFVYFNYLMKSISYGDTNSYNYANVVGYNKKNKNVDDRCVVKSMPIIELEVKDEVGNLSKYKFGAGCIYESMAYIMQKNMTKSVVNPPDLPYYSAIKLAEFIYKEFAENELNVLAMCDISLNTSNPGKVFVDIIERWKQKGEIPSNPRELYDEFYKETLQNTTATQNGTSKNEACFLDTFKSFSITAEQQLTTAYFRPTSESSQDEFNTTMRLINEWVVEIFKSAIKWRTENRYFILEMATCDKPHENKIFIDFFNDFGLPFCTNENNDGYFYHKQFLTSNLQLSYFSVVGEILNVFNGDFDKCGLFKYCQKCEVDKTSDVITDDRCSTPWKRSFDNRLCPFALVWRHWNLANYEPIFKTE